jgi:hypothetical protein
MPPAPGAPARGVAPRARADARRGDGAVAQREGVDRLAGDRVQDMDGVVPRDGHVTAAVHDARPVRGEPRDEAVGDQALGAAAEIEPDAGRAPDRRGRVVDPHAPPGLLVGRARAAASGASAAAIRRTSVPIAAKASSAAITTRGS